MPQVTKFVYTLNKAQQYALKEVYDRGSIYKKVAPGHLRPITYREFRRKVKHVSLLGCVMVEWHGMYLGIEEDGYTHS